MNFIQSILNGEHLYLLFEEIVNDEDFEKLETEIVRYISIKEPKHTQEFEDGGEGNLDDLNEEE